MKLIGIIGKSGSGKTTLSRMLQKDESFAIISLDKITNKNILIKRLPRIIATKYTNRLGEEKLKPSKSITNLIYIIKKNEFLDKLYLKSLEKNRESSIEEQIEKYKEEGKKYIIIERYNISISSYI